MIIDDDTNPNHELLNVHLNPTLSPSVIVTEMPCVYVAVRLAGTSSSDVTVSEAIICHPYLGSLPFCHASL